MTQYNVKTIDFSTHFRVILKLAGDPQEQYDDFYCHRGNMENRIKEQ